MKKKLFVLLFVFVFFLGSVEVRADAHYKISYDITNFSIGSDGNTIRFVGWSFLNHMDNYGGHNMETWIAAYTGNWNNDWNSNPMQSCANSDNKCYAISVPPGKIDGNTIDLYFVRCTDSACSNSKRKSIISNLGNGKKNFESKSCLNSGGYGGGHCTYHNVGFDVSMSINEIVGKLGTKSKIKFRIITKVKYGKKVKIGGNWGGASSRIDSSDIGIIGNSCSMIFNYKCSNEDKEYVRDITKSYYDENGNKIDYMVRRSVKIGGIDDTVLFTASSARRFKYQTSQSPIDPWNGVPYFSYGKNYSLDQVGTVKEYHNYKGDGKGTFYGRRIQIHRKGEKKYWAWSAWIKTTGHLELILKDDIQKTPPPPDPGNGGCTEQTKYCIGSGCRYNEKTCDFTWDEHPKIEVLNDTCDITRGTCSSAKYDTQSCSKTIEKVYYYRLSSAEVKKFFPNVILKYNSSYGVKLINGYYYFPVWFYGNADFNQSAELNLNFINKQNVDSGRSFHYSFDYKVSARWDYHGTYSENASKNNTYGLFIDVDIEDNNNKVSKRKVNVSLKPGDKLYSLDNNRVTEFTLSVDFYKNFVREKISGDAQSLSESSNYVNFPDSNDANSNIWVDNAGIFSCTVNSNNVWNAGTVNSATCSYKIKPAYFKNDGSGNIVYDPQDGYTISSNQGSSYYIPLNLKTGASFQFNVSATSLSLIRGITYQYTPTCSVGAVDRLDKLKYRPIDTSNPFPKNKIPDNWQNYINSKPNAMDRVIHHSFDGISYQTKKMDNSVTGKLKEIKTNIGDYESYNDLGVDNLGRSAVIWNEGQYNLFTIKQGNHCKVNQYDPSCDKVQGS